MATRRGDRLAAKAPWNLRSRAHTSVWAVMFGAVVVLACLGYAAIPSDLASHRAQLVPTVAVNDAGTNAADPTELYSPDGSWNHQTCTSAVLQQPTLEPLTLSAYEVLSQVPSPHLQRGASLPYTVIALLFHGCKTDKEYWQTGVAERLLTQQLLHQGAAIIAFGTASNGTCWQVDAHASNPDIIMVLSVLQGLVDKNAAFASLPLVAVGVSGGARLGSLLGSPLKLHAIVAAVCVMHTHFITNVFQRDVTLWPELTAGLPGAWRQDGAPRLIILYMPRDPKMGSAVKTQLTEIATIPGLDYHVFEASPMPLRPSFFHQYMPSRLSESEGQAFFSAIADIMIGDAYDKSSLRIGGASWFMKENPNAHFQDFFAALKPIVAARIGSMRSSSSSNVGRQEPGSGDLPSVPEACCTSNEDGTYASNGLCRLSDLHMFESLDGLTTEEAEVTLGTSKIFEAWIDDLMKMLKVLYASHEMTWAHLQEIVQLLIRGK